MKKKSVNQEIKKLWPYERTNSTCRWATCLSFLHFHLHMPCMVEIKPMALKSFKHCQNISNIFCFLLSPPKEAYFISTNLNILQPKLSCAESGENGPVVLEENFKSCQIIIF